MINQDDLKELELLLSEIKLLSQEYHELAYSDESNLIDKYEAELYDKVDIVEEMINEIIGPNLDATIIWI